MRVVKRDRIRTAIANDFDPDSPSLWRERQNFLFEETKVTKITLEYPKYNVGISAESPVLGFQFIRIFY